MAFGLGIYKGGSGQYLQDGPSISVRILATMTITGQNGYRAVTVPADISTLTSSVMVLNMSDVEYQDAVYFIINNSSTLWVYTVTGYTYKIFFYGSA